MLTAFTVQAECPHSLTCVIFLPSLKANRQRRSLASENLGQIYIQVSSIPVEGFDMVIGNNQTTNGFRNVPLQPEST